MLSSAHTELLIAAAAAGAPIIAGTVFSHATGTYLNSARHRGARKGIVN